MTLLKDSNYKNINIALLSLENDIKKLSNFDTSAINRQLEEINERIDKINAGSGSSSNSSSSGDNSAEINDLRAAIENINAQVSNNSTEIADINNQVSNNSTEIADINKQLSKEYTLNLKDLSNSNFYPVVIDTLFNFVDVEIYSEEGFDAHPYNQNRIKFTISTAGWSDTPKSLFISEYNRYDANEVTIGCIGYCNESDYKAVIWLRGGLWYKCYIMNSPSAPEVKTVDTALDTSIVTVGTSYSGGTNTKVSILFTPDSTMSSGIYSSAGMTAAGNLAIKNNTDATLSSFGQEPLSIGFSSGDNLGIDHNEIQARHNGAVAPLYLNDNGGKVVINDTKNSNGGLQVYGNTTLQSNSNVYLDSYGKELLSIGDKTVRNLGIDGDDIQARNNGNASSLDLNYYGGLVRVNGQGTADGGLQVSGRLNIPTSAPSSPLRGDIWLVL